MITFYPGPSRVNSQLPEYLRDAYLDGIMSINHRSPEFEAIYQRCVELLKEKLQVPDAYTVFFTSSATECWEIIAQSLIEKRSYHIYNGAFGEKWYQYTKKITGNAEGYKFDEHKAVKIKKLTIADETDFICLTQNETSNGSQVSNALIKRIRKDYPDKLLAIDATSSMAGIFLDFSNADIWYASVQKCFGLPAGLAIMICSPEALKKAKKRDENNHYNSLLFMMEKAQHNQTAYTPNVLNIYLLMRVMENSKGIIQVNEKMSKRFRKWEKFFNDFMEVALLIQNPEVCSTTVIALKGKKNRVEEIKEAAKKGGITLGNGYGIHKEDTFRIANFPAIKKKEIRLLKKFFTNNVK